MQEPAPHCVPRDTIYILHGIGKCSKKEIYRKLENCLLIHRKLPVMAIMPLGKVLLNLVGPYQSYLMRP